MKNIVIWGYAIEGGFRHCNHKVNELIAEEIYLKIENDLKANSISDLFTCIQVNERKWIEETYMQQYFSEYSYKENEIIGSIVMNCNPFTLGHRYLIEKALERVNRLIIFVVEEDKSLFTFEERLFMVKEGVRDLENIIVVPSGRFILSDYTFPEYFVKTVDIDRKNNMEYDIEVFASCIASKLNIKYRFAGEEKLDAVTEEYNKTMRRVLKKYGIGFIEIPRKEINGKLVS